MSDDTPGDGEVDLHGRSGLQRYYQTVKEDWSVTKPLAGLFINLGLAGFGAIAYAAFTGWPAYLGLVWAAINLAGIIKWVFE